MKTRHNQMQRTRRWRSGWQSMARAADRERQASPRDTRYGSADRQQARLVKRVGCAFIDQSRNVSFEPRPCPIALNSQLWLKSERPTTYEHTNIRHRYRTSVEDVFQRGCFLDTRTFPPGIFQRVSLAKTWDALEGCKLRGFILDSFDRDYVRKCCLLCDAAL